MRRQGAAVAALLFFATTTNSQQQSCMGSLMATAGTTRDAYTPDGPVAKRIASVTPYFPFKGIPKFYDCLLYTSPSPRDATLPRMPSSA